MIRRMTSAALLALALASAVPAAAQSRDIQALAGTRLDVTASGEVSRVPDIVRLEAGVVTTAPRAGEALRQNAERMERARAALAAAGIADRDIQTRSVSLQANYPAGYYGQGEPIGYTATNQIMIRFREVAGAGRVLDALVAAGVNRINGPTLDFEHPEAAQDEARTLAIRNARARADLYARALGTRVKRVVFVYEAPPDRDADEDRLTNIQVDRNPGSTIDPGGRLITVRVTAIFELE